MTARRGQAGLTLLEALVTLVIAAMVATLMAEGLFQLGHVERRMGSGQLQARLQRLHVLWVQQSLEGLRAGEAGTQDELRGNARRIAGISSMLPTPEPVGPMPVTLSLAYRQSVNETELTMDIGPVEKRLQSAVLARWKGDTGRFGFLDPRGGWVTDWPPTGLNAPLLPSAVAIYGADGEAVVVAALQSTPQRLGKRIDLEKLP